MTQNIANKNKWSKQTHLICSPPVQHPHKHQHKMFTSSPLIFSLDTLQNSKC